MPLADHEEDKYTPADIDDGDAEGFMHLSLGSRWCWSFGEFLKKQEVAFMKAKTCRILAYFGSKIV